MQLEVTPFDAAQATDDDLVEYYDLTTQAHAVDRPDAPLPTYEALIARLRVPTDLGPARRWAARRDGRMVATATSIFPESENTNQTITEVRVLPKLRRQGIGTAVLREILPQIRAEGRTVVSGFGLTVGGPGQKWATSLGFARVQEWARQTLVVADVDPERWQVPAPEGYRAERWIGAAPESLVAAFARARGAIGDAPQGEWTFAHPDWTVERVRTAEAEARERNEEQRVVVAVHQATGQIAGLTVIDVELADPSMAYQGDTAVLAEFRGHGLGRFIKAEMMRWLLAGRPEIERVTTQNAADNAHMIRVNREIGYTVTRVMTVVEADVEALASRM